MKKACRFLIALISQQETFTIHRKRKPRWHRTLALTLCRLSAASNYCLGNTIKFGSNWVKGASGRGKQIQQQKRRTYLFDGADDVDVKKKQKGRKLDYWKQQTINHHFMSITKGPLNWLTTRVDFQLLLLQKQEEEQVAQL